MSSGRATAATRFVRDIAKDAAPVAGGQEAASDPAASRLNKSTDPAMQISRNLIRLPPIRGAAGLIGTKFISSSCPFPVTPVIYGPDKVRDDFYPFDLDDFDRVAAKIDRIYQFMYSESKADYLASRYCSSLGLLDPKSNIMINGAIFSYAEHSGIDKAMYAEPWVEAKPGDMGERSLRGLITFLACLFPCLPDGEALAYLDAVDADPMAAAALVLSKRGVKSNTTAAATIEMALTCAAVATKHPYPWLFVQGWKNVSCRHPEVKRYLLILPENTGICDAVNHVLGMTFPHVEVSEMLRLASARLGHGRITVHLSVSAVMKRMLLEKIHGFYLKALSRLPKSELTKKYHRALVIGGYCYGPLNPVANIIANMVWYEQTFPPSIEVESAMISTRFLSRIVARSLYGLITFLCARYPRLSPVHAMQRLLVADANLQLADPYLVNTRCKQKLHWSDCPQIVSAITDAKFQEKAVRKAFVSVPEAYAAAATAAFHPYPAAQKEFLGSPLSVHNLGSASTVFHLYDDDCQLSKQGIHFLGMHLLGSPSVAMSHLQQEPEPTEEPSQHIIWKRDFWKLHDNSKAMVISALEKFNRDNDTQYSLHSICGVNERVSGPNLCSHDDIVSDPSFPCEYEHCHINFLATCLDEELHDQLTCLYFADQPTKLFFAECSRAGDDSRCAPVDCSAYGQARCFYCEKQGSKIIHPASLGFHGSNFQEGWSFSGLYSNDRLIGMGHALDWVLSLEEDVIYGKDCIHQFRHDGVPDYGQLSIEKFALDDVAPGLKRITPDAYWG